MKLYYSVGWKKPECYTPFDLSLNPLVNTNNGIVDCGPGYHRYDNVEELFDNAKLHKADFVVGFDDIKNGIKKDRIDKEILNTLKNSASPFYPICHTQQQINKYSKLATGITITGRDKLKIPKNVKHIHHLGNSSNGVKCSTYDINPYQSGRFCLIDSLNYDIVTDETKTKAVAIVKELFKNTKNEVIIYGSALYYENAHDLDILVYGKTANEYDYLNGEKDGINAVCIHPDDNEASRLSHIVFALRHGYPLTNVHKLGKIYEKSFQRLNENYITMKMRLAYQYAREGDYKKEIKTLVIGLAYSKLENTYGMDFVEENMHLLYKALQGDMKAVFFLKHFTGLELKPLKEIEANSYNRCIMYKEEKYVDIIKDIWNVC